MIFWNMTKNMKHTSKKCNTIFKNIFQKPHRLNNFVQGAAAGRGHAPCRGRRPQWVGPAPSCWHLRLKFGMELASIFRHLKWRSKPKLVVFFLGLRCWNGFNFSIHMSLVSNLSAMSADWWVWCATRLDLILFQTAAVVQCWFPKSTFPQIFGIMDDFHTTWAAA